MLYAAICFFFNAKVREFRNKLNWIVKIDACYLYAWHNCYRCFGKLTKIGRHLVIGWAITQKILNYTGSLWVKI